MQKTVTIELNTGILHIDIEQGHIPLKRLLGFATRRGSKRKFLLLSKIIGRFHPVSPGIMSWSYRALARILLSKAIADKSVWIAMAEAGTGLGYGVYEAACREGMSQALFMQTTRYHLEASLRLEFQEVHSHATDFFLYYPENENYRHQFLTTETLVLIDDEISTGKTFLRLIKAFQGINPRLKKVFIVSLVNFADPVDRQTIALETAIPIEWVSLRQGVLRFENSKNQTESDSVHANASSNSECKKHLLAWPGRLGISTPVLLEDDVLEKLRHIAPHIQLQESRPILILGTGECMAPAFLLGRKLEHQGFKVRIQNTTRTPLCLGNDIASMIQFKDNYQDGIANFLYNVNPECYQEIIVCHETPLCAEILTWLHQWQAISARFELNPESTDATLHFFRP